MHNFFYVRHNVVYAHGRGVHKVSVFRLFERSDGSVRIVVVTLDYVLQKRVEIHFFALCLEFVKSSSRSLFGSCCKEEFAICIRQDESAYISAVKHNVVLFAKSRCKSTILYLTHGNAEISLAAFDI